MTGLATFNTPCFRYKLVSAGQPQYGWPGFLAPYQSRYLIKTVVTTLTNLFDGTVKTGSAVFTLDRLLGTVSVNPPNPILYYLNSTDFPYGQPLVNHEAQFIGDSTTIWGAVTETNFSVTIITGVGEGPNSGGVQQFTLDVTLSNPYTIAMLDADIDTQLQEVDPDDLNWGTLNIISLGDVLSDVNDAIPPQWNYAGIFSPITQVALKAAAYSAWEPGAVGPNNWFPNESVKVVGWIAMAGNYCLETYTIDLTGATFSTCNSGVGSCSAPFEVTPPPLSETTDAYVVITPNCQC